MLFFLLLQVLDAFNAANLLNPYKFGMCLQPTYGNLDIGDSDPAKYSGSLTYIDFVSDPSNPNSGYYTTSMTSSKLGTTELLTGTVEAIWDSGTTLIAGTTAWSDAFKAAARTAQAAFVEELLQGTSDVALTDAQLASWPDLKFSFPTNTSSTYTISVNSSQYMLLTNGFYKLGLDLNGQSKFLLGDVMLQMVYVEYNNVNYQLGVAPVADCTHVLTSGGGCSLFHFCQMRLFKYERTLDLFNFRRSCWSVLCCRIDGLLELHSWTLLSCQHGGFAVCLRCRQLLPESRH
jgi:hypothetical protein